MSWPTVTIADACSLVTDGTHYSPSATAQGVPFLTVKDMTSEGLSFDSAIRISPADYQKAAEGNSAPRPGDVLFSKDGTVGKVHVVSESTEFAVLSSIAILRPNLRFLDSMFFGHVLRSPVVLRRATQSKTGSALTRIVLKDLKDVRLPLPPLAEQRRIAAVLDKADAIRRKRRESLRLLDEFLRSAFLEMFGDPVRNGKGWEVERLGEIAGFLGGGTPSRAGADYFTGTTCWATSKDFLTEEMFDTQEHVTPQAIESSATSVVPPGTILVVVKSKILMHRLPVAITRVGICFSQDVKAIVMRDRGMPAAYVARHLRVGQQALLHKARGANTEGLTLDHLRSYRVMIPPRPMLNRWEAIESKCTALRLTAAGSLSDSASLFDSLAQRAFRGEAYTSSLLNAAP